MPLTALQTEALRLLAANRSPESFFAGSAAIVIDGARSSDDFDLFHGREAELDNAAARDEATLRGAGLEIEWLRIAPTFRRARIARGEEAFLLDWAIDSDFRFFPIEADARFGFRLHPVDIATNKILAAVGRRTPRDIIDLLTLHNSVLPISALAWAATGKDPGLTPWWILNELQRTGHYRQDELNEVEMTPAPDAAAISRAVREAVGDGQALIEQLPARDVGCVYLDAADRPVAPDPARLSEYRRHFGSRGGHWPTSSEVLSEMMRRDEKPS